MDENGFLSMGGYAGFVWPAYLVAALVLAALALVSLWQLVRTRRMLVRLESDVASLGTGSPP